MSLNIKKYKLQIVLIGVFVLVFAYNTLIEPFLVNGISDRNQSTCTAVRSEYGEPGKHFYFNRRPEYVYASCEIHGKNIVIRAETGAIERKSSSSSGFPGQYGEVTYSYQPGDQVTVYWESAYDSAGYVASARKSSEIGFKAFGSYMLFISFIIFCAYIVVKIVTRKKNK